MKTYTIKLTEHAAADLKALRDYIAQTLHEPETGRRKVGRILEEIKSLSFLPQRNALMPTEPERSSGIRKTVAENHYILYTIDADTVQILRVIYSSCDLIQRLRSGR